MLVEMELREILRGNDITAIVLGEKEGEGRQFPVYIGQFEALALEWAVHGIQQPRPFTHDLILNVIEGMQGHLRRIIIDKLTEDSQTGGGTFHGKLDIELFSHQSVWIDCRPSDAMVLASKAGVPVFVDEEVLRQINARPPASEGEDEGEGEEEPGEE